MTTAVASIADALRAALAHHIAGRLDAAATLYRDVLAAQPKNFDALHLLGALRRREGDLRAAVELISAALTINPDFAPAHANLAAALQDRGQIRDAMEAYRTALTLDPRAAGIHRGLLGCLLHLSDLDPDARFEQHRRFGAQHAPRAEDRLRAPDNTPTPSARCASASCRRICARTRSAARSCR